VKRLNAVGHEEGYREVHETVMEYACVEQSVEG
jgi:hypothetical protein